MIDSGHVDPLDLVKLLGINVKSQHGICGHVVSLLSCCDIKRGVFVNGDCKVSPVYVCCCHDLFFRSSSFRDTGNHLILGHCQFFKSNSVQVIADLYGFRFPEVKIIVLYL